MLKVIIQNQQRIIDDQSKNIVDQKEWLRQTAYLKNKYMADYEKFEKEIKEYLSTIKRLSIQVEFEQGQKIGYQNSRLEYMKSGIILKKDNDRLNSIIADLKSNSHISNEYPLYDTEQL